jgi:hypothetical protein
MRGTGIEKDEEICATNITNKTKCMSRHANKWEKKNLCMGAHALGFVANVCSTNFYLLFCPSSTHVGVSSQFL